MEQYSTESSVYQEGDDRINIEIPGVSNANEILDELGQPGSLYFIAQTGSDGTPNYEQVNSTGDAAKDYQLKKSLEELEADGSLVLTGSDVKSAKAETMENQTTKAKETLFHLFLRRMEQRNLQTLRQKRLKHRKVSVSTMTEALSVCRM